MPWTLNGEDGMRGAEKKNLLEGPGGYFWHHAKVRIWFTSSQVHRDGEGGKDGPEPGGEPRTRPGSDSPRHPCHPKALWC